MNDGVAMGSYTERMRRISVTVSSPDQTVRAHYSGANGVKVEPAPRGIDGHSSQSLAEQVNAAVRGLIDGSQQATKAVEGERPTRPRLSGQQAAMREAASQISVRLVSRRQNFKISISGDGEPQLQIRPGVLDRIDISTEQLFSEMNAIIAQSIEDYARQLMAICRPQ